jgi:hypothetical protein
VRQRPIQRVAAAQVQPLDEENHCGEGDAEADERDMDRERERLHLTRLQQVFLLDGLQCDCEKCGDVDPPRQSQP